MKISRFCVYLHQNLSDLLRFCFIGCIKEIWEHYYITTFCECQPFWCEKLKATGWSCSQELNWTQPDWRTFISQLHWVGTASLDGLMDQLPGIESDGANSQALSPRDGVEKCWKWLLLPTHSNGPSQLPGIEPGKMSEVVASCNLFKWTGDLYSHPSLGRFCRTHQFS